jgi:glycerol-3-phosphate dehydrogenase
MNRESTIERIQSANARLNIVVIGGGATGAGIALDAANRGLNVLLLERDDFGSGTSSRSTKIIHGGVRYLAQGRIGLVREALRERAYLLRNAPHLVTPQAFSVPIENVVEGAKYFIGLKLYDLLSGAQQVQACHWLSKHEMEHSISALRKNYFRGAMRYFDAQFDDTRLLMTILHSAAREGAALLNYAEVIALNKSQSGQLKAVTFRDRESNHVYELETHTVINATGATSDAILKLDEPTHRLTIHPSQGAHIVVGREFLPGGDAILMPRTPDGRIMFAIPWLDHVLLGTTDTSLQCVPRDPVPQRTEIEMILDVAGQYLEKAPKSKDILSSFAGIRPLLLEPSESQTSKVSREHRIDVLPSGLVSISGGKWTTYRLMAEQCVDTVVSLNKWSVGKCATTNLPLCRRSDRRTLSDEFIPYGDNADALERLIAEYPAMNELLCDELPYRVAHCVWAIRSEMARTLEDILARRTRALFLNKSATRKVAPKVLQLLASELNLSATDQKNQLERFNQVARFESEDD